LSPEHREYAELLVQKSRDELNAAQTLMATDDWAPHVVGFLLQQTVEKAMKSVLAAREIEIPHTHDLGELSERLSESGVRMPSTLGSIDWLTPWGVTFRYDDPGISLDTSAGLDAAHDAVGLAEEALAEDPQR
jgi:HEPN domain-containing protein